MSGWDREAYEAALRADLRAHDGVVTEGPLAGHRVMILTSTGAKTGEARHAFLTWSKDGDDYVVAGTAGGSPTTPAWVANVRHTPEVQVQAEGRTMDATGRVIDDGPERDRLWAEHVATWPHFAEYPEKSGRLIPVVRLSPA